MCGIAGAIGIPYLESSYLKILSLGIQHRGRDSDGIFVESPNININCNLNTLKRFVSEPGVAFVHRRLSIIDLNERSRQPFIDPDGSIVITFNGEIYNYLEIRNTLIKDFGEKFETNSDTEVLLKSYKRYGINCFKLFNGFWAVAIFDKNLGSVFLSRDYYGKKPLYIMDGVDGKGFFFSSELKPLINLKKSVDVDPDSVFDYLVFDQRDAFKPSMFGGVKEVPAGVVMQFDAFGNYVNEERYFELPAIENVSISFEEAQAEYNRLLDKAISLRLRADVPIDINLSGGLDSSAIALAAVKNGQKNIGCHTFRFDGEGIDESPQAQLIANSLGISLNIINISQNDIWNKVDDFINISEEPVHSPTTFVQQAAWDIINNEDYKVILHGSGNDEFLAGYQYYEQIFNLETLEKGQIVNYFSNSHYGIKTKIGRLVKWCILNNNIRNKSYLRSLYTNKFISDDFNKKMISRYNYRIELLKNINLSVEARRTADISYLRFPYWNKLMDKNSMSLPIEVRMPFYDKELSQFVLSLPSKYLFRNGFTKSLLRGYIGDNLPSSITENHVKTGFQTPDKLWMFKYKDKIISEVEMSCTPQFIDVEYFKNNYNKFSGRQLWRIYNFSKWYGLFFR